MTASKQASRGSTWIASLTLFLLSNNGRHPKTGFTMAFSASRPLSHRHNHIRDPLTTATCWTNPNSNPNPNRSTSSTSTALSVRGGGVTTTLSSFTSSLSTDPKALFNTNLIGLALITATIKVYQRLSTTTSTTNEQSNTLPPKTPAMKSLQIRFLLVFWLLRCADWLQGPYFYETYSSKIFNGVPASLSTVSNLFLTGFASTALFGPLVGRMSDTHGRKRGTLAFAMLYVLGAASTKSSVLGVLLLGRVMGGIGTSLLFSAPEAWLVGEAGGEGVGDVGGRYLGETFGLAYAGDSLVAILAGQLAGAAAGVRGPTGPFELSIGFLALGGILAALLWKENKAGPSSSSTSSGDDTNPTEQTEQSPTIRDAVGVVRSDPKIMLVGLSQALFEAAMYIFVLQWPPAVTKTLKNAFASVTGGTAPSTPYGTVFSCFMACCLLGSTVFGQLSNMGISTETSTAGMLSVATLAMATAAYVVSTAGTAGALIAMPFAVLVAAFFVFEGCVGLYFPSIGTLRSKYLPDSHRTVIMNLFGIPLNALVVSVFLSIERLGVGGALSISASALGLAAASMWKLKSMVGKESK